MKTRLVPEVGLLEPDEEMEDCQKVIDWLPLDLREMLMSGRSIDAD